MTVLRRLSLAALATPLALALVACGSKDNGTPAAAPSGAAIAAVPAPAGQMWSDVVSATADDGMMMGNPNAKLKLVEYGGHGYGHIFENVVPHCAKLANDGMKTLVDKYVNTGRVSYEYRSFPIHGIIDIPATVMVRCADKAAFFPLVEQLYATQDQWIAQAEKGNAAAQAAANLPAQQRFGAMADILGLTDWFAARGVSKDQSHACLANADAAEKVAKDGQQWGAAGIDSTPTLFLNGIKLENVYEWSELEPALQNAGAR